MRKFGQFTAVDHVSFEVRRREIFGLLGPNGAGKTTTFRMLCGLLPATSGTLQVAGVDLQHRARLRAPAHRLRRAEILALRPAQRDARTSNSSPAPTACAAGAGASASDWAMSQFELTPLANLPSGQLPGGYKQRLAMAAALMHEPDILFLDEPTSGADPLARREFWRRITALSDQGVTVIITTHFMEEAEYCDRAVIQDAGRILAQGTPAEIRAHAEGRTGDRRRWRKPSSPSSRRRARSTAILAGGGVKAMNTTHAQQRKARSRRILALVIKESRQIVRDPSSIAIAVVMPTMLILLFGFALSLDVKNVDGRGRPGGFLADRARRGGRLRALALFRAAFRGFHGPCRAAHARARRWTASSASAPTSPAG